MMMKKLLILLFILFATVGVQITPHADLVFRNAIIFTLDPQKPRAEAIAVTGDKIAWAGSEKEMKARIGKNTKVIDLGGSYVYPGFIDSHAHINSVGSTKFVIDLVGTPDKQQILEKVKAKAASTKEGHWILGRGWDQNDWPVKQFPSAADLDAVAPNNPVFLERIDGHASWVNSAALKMAGITAETPDPEGGKIHRDENGNPTGILIDNAMTPVEAKMKAPSIGELRARTEAALQEALSKGITMIQDAGTTERDLEVWKEMAQKDDLPVRIYAMVAMPSSFGEKFLSEGPQSYGPYLDVRSIKIVIDGAMGSRGAAMLKPYTDDSQNLGLLRWNETDLVRVLQQAKAKGVQVNIHAIGDRANRLVLDSYEKTGVASLRWRIEHAQVVDQQDIGRFSELQVIASMQPTHATSDGPWAPDRLGPERLKGAYAWRSLMQHKTRIAGGSDAPVEDINPLWGIYSAITRADHQGKAVARWTPDQRVTAQEAIEMFTVNAAYSAFRENELGSIKSGKLADFVVLPKDLSAAKPEELIKMKVLQTVVGGKIRYTSPN